MSLKFYKAYKKCISKKPVEQWREITQETINETWLNTSTLTTVYGQTLITSKDFGEESVQLTSVIDAKTGKELGDDFRRIIYKNYLENELPPSIIPAKNFIVDNYSDSEKFQFQTIDGEDFLVRSSERFLGKYYKFHDSVWLTVNTNTIIGSSASAILKKCNNVLRWYDKHGKLQEWDCIFSRSLSSTNFDWGSKEVPEVDATITIQVQRNPYTNEIPFNQRFIFDGHAFQVNQINNHISDTYMELYLFETQVQRSDDVINNIANNNINAENYEIEILPKISKILKDETETFTVYNIVNGVEDDSTFDIIVDCECNPEDYTLEVINGNSFKITNNKESKYPLIIKCTNSKTKNTGILNLILGGDW